MVATESRLRRALADRSQEILDTQGAHLRGILADQARRAEGAAGEELLEQAVRAYTLGAAYAAGRERELGSIQAGKLADLTVLDRDIFSIDPHEILGTSAAAVMIGGNLAYGSL